ncbi:ABC transporter ATP-binding protein [Streptomyces melanogenes]|uniref:ABC transporter ATP-binding protein n=1 Tax=Streptomyces melanogenes TaxID=67326 RepID=UPI0037B6679E
MTPPRTPGNGVLLLRALRTAGLPIVLALTVLLVVDAVIPAAVALGVGTIVDRLDTTNIDELTSAVALPLTVYGVTLFVGYVAEVFLKPLEFVAAARIDGCHRAEIMRLTTGHPSIAPLETPGVQALIREAGAEPDHGVTPPSQGALTQLRWLTRLIGAVAASAVLARYSWWLAPTLLIPSAVGLYIRSRQYFAAIRALGAALQEELHADVWRSAATSAAEGKDVRVFGFADWMVERMQRHIHKGNAPFWGHVMRVARQSWLQFGLALIGLLPVYVAVTYDAAHGRTPIDVQTAVLVAAWSLFQALGTGEEVYRMVSAGRVLRAREELRDHMALPKRGKPTPVDPLPTSNAYAKPPHVRFDNVSFTYPGTDRRILDRLDLEIRPGELLAVVGLNGAGKSTLIKLLAGLYEPDSGRITADDTEVGALGWDAWRTRVSVVFQDFVRYELPAADNVALGQASKPADLAAVQAAATEAGFDDVLERLPDGWNTPLVRSRTGGVDLSGGQWQQVVLARALYSVRKGARLLVLDEPTAHLDVRTEFDVFHRLAQHRGDTSVVLISHRLSTVRQADRIVLLDEGRITETGTHDELIALGGAYATLFAIQSERFQQDLDDAADGLPTEGSLL